MLFEYPRDVITGTFIRRLNRFVVEVKLSDGSIMQAHTPNTGSLMGLLEQGNEVLLFDSGNPKRKYRYSWKAVRVKGQWRDARRQDDVWVSIDTLLPNRMVFELLARGLIPGFDGYDEIQREVSVEKGTRIDIQLRGRGRAVCHVEVKNVTLVRDGRAAFPDAVTSRGLRHVRFMQKAVEQGDRGVLVFTIQREDGEIFTPAWDIDPAYAEALTQACGAGVQIIPLVFQVTPQGVRFLKVVPFDLSRY